MNSLLIPPPLYKGEPHEQQQAADKQLFYQTNILPDVLRFDVATVGGNITDALVRIPQRRSMVTTIRVYTSAPGSGSFHIEPFWSTNAGTLMPLYAGAGDALITAAGSGILVFNSPTANVLVDPRDPSLAGRFQIKTTNFAGTAWNGVVVEILLRPLTVR